MKNKIYIVLFKNISKIVLIILSILLLNTFIPNYILNNFFSNENLGIKLAIIIKATIYLSITILQTMCEIDEIKKSSKD